MDVIKLGTEELREIEILLAEKIESPNQSLVILHRIFSGQSCICFCKMNGGGSLKIKAPLHFVSRFILNLRFENENGSSLIIPRKNEERTISLKDLYDSEILLLAAPMEDRRGSFSIGCMDGKGKVEADSPLEVAFMLQGEWEDYIELARPRGRRNYFRPVRRLVCVPAHN